MPVREGASRKSMPRYPLWRCYSLEEMMAEKVRTLIGQRRYAISRDLYDIDAVLPSGVLRRERAHPGLPPSSHHQRPDRVLECQESDHEQNGGDDLDRPRRSRWGTFYALRPLARLGHMRPATPAEEDGERDSEEGQGQIRVVAEPAGNSTSFMVHSSVLGVGFRDRALRTSTTETAMTTIEARNRSGRA
ncbi:MAG: nucleotidyl transferase AbiEii/AbiGii toxin family protein [Gemmatimonadota bacterium]